MNFEYFKPLSKSNVYQNHIKNSTKIQMAVRLANILKKRNAILSVLIAVGSEERSEAGPPERNTLL